MRQSPARTRVAVPPATEKHQPASDPGGIESSLLRVLQDHHREYKRRRQRKRQKEKKRGEGIGVNGGCGALAATIARFMEQTDQCLTATRTINTAIKEMKTMEFDCKNINAAIRNIHQGCLHRNKLQDDPFIHCEACQKLVEVGGYFKVEPLGNIDSEVKKHLGLGNDMVIAASTNQVLLLNKMTCSPQLTSIQVSREYALHSVFLPGGEVPDWFHHWGGEGDETISFHLLPVVGQKLIGFSLCLKYWHEPQQTTEDEKFLDFIDFCLVISNKTTGERCHYDPLVYALPRSDEDVLIWLSYWMLEELGDVIPLGEGDEVKLTLSPSTFDVEEWGIRLICIKEEEQATTEPMLRQLSPRFYRRTFGSSFESRISMELVRLGRMYASFFPGE